jgi:hypothetical protein
MQRSSIAPRRVWFRVVCVLIGVHAMGTAFALRASSFSANLSVSVVFPSIAGLPANTSVNGGAAAMLPPCVVTATPPGTGMCTNPTDTRLSPPQGTTMVTFTAGPISGTAPQVALSRQYRWVPVRKPSLGISILLQSHFL